MKRADEVLVGAVVLVGIVLAIVGTVWLSQARYGPNDQERRARFRTIGGLQVGDPVLLRGVRIGRVERIALGEREWVNVALRIKGDAELPRRPIALIFSATLFGDWSVQLLSQDALPDDPEVRRLVREAAVGAGDMMPGATLPDVGQLTAQAGRIAGDIATIAGRVQDAFDSTSAARLKSAFLDLSRLSRTLAQLAATQQQSLLRIGANLDTGTAALARTAEALERTASRADSATSRAQLQSILTNTDSITSDVRAVASDLRGITGAARNQQEAFVRIVAHADSLLAEVQAGQGSLGRLMRDTTLYHESIETVRSLRTMLEDMQRNPRKYFSFSVF